jgi:hypothetical protein
MKEHNAPVSVLIIQTNIVYTLPPPYRLLRAFCRRVVRGCSSASYQFNENMGYHGDDLLSRVFQWAEPSTAILITS